MMREEVLMETPISPSDALDYHAMDSLRNIDLTYVYVYEREVEAHEIQGGVQTGSGKPTKKEIIVGSNGDIPEVQYDFFSDA